LRVAAQFTKAAIINLTRDVLERERFEREGLKEFVLALTKKTKHLDKIVPPAVALLNL
jgi:hypothetical protein